MVLGPGRLTGGRNQNEIGLGRSLFWEDRGFRRSFSVASSPSFSCESAVSSRAELWRLNWKLSRSTKLPEDSSFKDLKRVIELRQDKVIQEEIREQQLTMHQGQSLEELSSPLEEEGDYPEA
jgi:hypothetical protein